MPYHISIKLIISAILFFTIFKLSLTIANKLNLFWVLRAHIFCSVLAKEKNNLLDNRIKQFADFIVETFDDKADETILFTHCLGSIISTKTLAEIKRNHPNFDISKLKFITFGQIIPWLSFLPEANKYRKDLKLLSNSDINWTDISSPADYICFALVDPYKYINKNTENTVKLINPRFFELFNEKEYKKIKKDRLRIHFQYLMAGDILGKYDFYQITASNNMLEENINKL